MTVPDALEFEDYKGDHAGMCETQQLMALCPQLVDLGRKAPTAPADPWCGAVFAKTGRRPNRETGEKIIASQVEKLGRIQRELLGAYEPKDGWAVPNQDRVEEYWQTFERITRKYWTASSTFDEYRAGAPPFPGWDALGL